MKMSNIWKISLPWLRFAHYGFSWTIHTHIPSLPSRKSSVAYIQIKSMTLTHTLTLGFFRDTYLNSGVSHWHQTLTLRSPLTPKPNSGSLPDTKPWLLGSLPAIYPDCRVFSSHIPWLWGPSLTHTLNMWSLSAIYPDSRVSPWHIPRLLGPSLTHTLTLGSLPNTYPDSRVPPWHIPWLLDPSLTHTLTLGPLTDTYPDSGVPPWHIPWLWDPTLGLKSHPDTYPDSRVPPSHIPWL